MDQKLAKIIENQNIYSWGSFLKMTTTDLY